ncbi:MAG: hypothetical protein RMJ28_07255 [Nitrososphaerota archaeon]|nr:hypothetical protein [Candidatus Calditenuaceae archaeon]MDW8074011.1 hypothetical protein [Nitrososphaerota archaeon]
MSNRALLAALAVFTASAVFSVPILVSQVAVLPNRPDTIYELGYSSTRIIRIRVAQLQLIGNDVYRVDVTYTRGVGAATWAVFQAGLYDANGNQLAIGSACVSVPAGAGTTTVQISLTGLADAYSVARVITCVAIVSSCPSSVMCL